MSYYPYLSSVFLYLFIYMYYKYVYMREGGREGEREKEIIGMDASCISAFDRLLRSPASNSSE